MATKQPKTTEPKNPTASTTVVAAADAVSTALAETIDYGADVGAGLEGATADSFAIPFLGVLQKGSPQVDEASGAAIEGAKAGMLYESVSGRMYPGKTGVLFVPCAYRRVFLRWGARGTESSGFRGELSPEAVAAMREDGRIVEVDGGLYVPDEDGTIRRGKDGKVLCDRVADTRNHYGLIVDPETGDWTTALLSLTSTQVKKSKMLASLLASRKVKTAAGMMPAPTWASTVRVTTLPESNEKGTWYGVKFEIEGPLLPPTHEWYRAGRDFHAMVRSGAVSAKYEDVNDENERSGSGGAF